MHSMLHGFRNSPVDPLDVDLNVSDMQVQDPASDQFTVYGPIIQQEIDVHEVQVDQFK